MDVSLYPRHRILCSDIKSFYASAEAVARGLDPLRCKLVVVGDVHRSGSVVLAASPLMKKQHGIGTGSRLYEVQSIKDPDIYVVQARMAYYMAVSRQVTDIYRRFVPDEALHTYSVDESWLTLDGTEKLWGTSWDAARKIAYTIREETGLIATIGIGDNKFLAKLVLDQYAKKQGIAEAKIEDVPSLFHHLPVRELWGVGEGIEKRVQRLGCFTIGDIAQRGAEPFIKEFGVIGEQLFFHCWGIDTSPVFYNEGDPPETAFGFDQDLTSNAGVKSVGRGVTLLEDYHLQKDILIVIRDLVEEVGEVLRRRKLAGKTVHLSLRYAKQVKEKGFSRQRSFPDYWTNDIVDILTLCRQLFEEHYKKGRSVRKIRVSVSGLTKDMDQYSFDEEKEKRKKLLKAMDTVNDKFGKGTLRSGVAYTNQSISGARKDKLGGHTK